MTDPKEEFEKTLAEKKFEAQAQEAEIDRTDVVKFRGGESTGLQVWYSSAIDNEMEDTLPMPTEYDPERSDLVTLLEFTGVNPNDIDSLVGKRVPLQNQSIGYETMRAVLQQQAEAKGDWNYEKRRQKAKAWEGPR